MDTDVFGLKSLDSLRTHEFTMAFDNIVNPDEKAPKRLNNGVILSSPTSQFLKKWVLEYVTFDPTSWDQHSSVIPFKLATTHPDLIHVEWSRLSPISYGFQTSEAAAALTCGIYDPIGKAILNPYWNPQKKTYTFENIEPSKKLFDAFNAKLVLHLTMSQVR